MIMLQPKTRILITKRLAGVFKCSTDLIKYKNIQILFGFVPVCKIVFFAAHVNWFIMLLCCLFSLFCLNSQ